MITNLLSQDRKLYLLNTFICPDCRTEYLKTDRNTYPKTVNNDGIYRCCDCVDMFYFLCDCGELVTADRYDRDRDMCLDCVN